MKWADDAYITRREFTKFLGLTSVALVVGTCYATLRRLFLGAHAGDSVATHVADLKELPIGGYKQIHFPTADDPCILLRLDERRIVAYSQHCTHLSCPVHFEASSQRLLCPCHEAAFSAEDGRVLAGPPKRPLLRFHVELRGDQVWIQPMEVKPA